MKEKCHLKNGANISNHDQILNITLIIITLPGSVSEAHFTWFTHFASLDCPASGAKSRKTLDWQPKQTGLLEDLASGVYF